MAAEVKNRGYSTRNTLWNKFDTSTPLDRTGCAEITAPLLRGTKEEQRSLSHPGHPRKPKQGMLA